jgi:hypothetical protein
VTTRQRARSFLAPFAILQLFASNQLAGSTTKSSGALLYIRRLFVDMDEILRPPQLDELGLPLRPSNRGGDEDIGDEMMQRFQAGDFSDLNLPQPSSFPTAAEAQQEA